MSQACYACNTTPRPASARLNASGRWEVGGVDLLQLAEQFGTPLYVLDKATIEANCRDYLDGFKDYPGGFEITFASKSLPLVGIDRLIYKQGFTIEASSYGEVHVALAAGVPGTLIRFSGNNKTLEEINYAISKGVKRFLVDGIDELKLLHDAAPAGTEILLRVTPGIEAHTHEFIRTGQTDSKFGFALESLPEAYALLADSHLCFCGLQAHIGSQIFDVAPFKALVETMLLETQKTKAYGLNPTELDLGGGLGIAYTEADNPPAIRDFVEQVAKTVEEKAQELGMELPRLILEPGRSIVGTAGITLYQVGHEKVIPGVRRYLMVDGGMPDNPRPITYGAEYLADTVESRPKCNETITIAGKCCESGDILIWDAKVQAKSGDLLIVWGTGAYCFAMSSNYNRLPRPAVVMVGDGESQLIRRRETLDDLIAAEVNL